MYYAKQAEGHGRTDWVVMGPCSCVARYHDECGCLRCEGMAEIVRFDGLTESEALDYADRLNAGTFTPFNPPRVNHG